MFAKTSVQRRNECSAAWTPATDEPDNAFGQIAVVLCEQLCPFITAPSFVQQQEEEEKKEEAAALCFQLWPVWASLIQPTRPLAGSIWASPSVSSSDQICVRPFFSPGHLLAWYSGRTDSSRSGQTAMCKPCRVGTGWAYIAHGAKVWTENSTVTRVNLGTAHLCNRTLHLAAAAVVVLHSPDLYILRQTRGSTACHSCSVKIYWIYLLQISSTLLGTFCSLLFMYFAAKHFHVLCI